MPFWETNPNKDFFLKLSMYLTFPVSTGVWSRFFTVTGAMTSSRRSSQYYSKSVQKHISNILMIIKCP